MFMFLLLFLLATLFIYEEKTKKTEEEEREELENVLEDMISQLHCNQLEIMKNKSGSLILLKTMNKLICTLRNSYEQKMARWESELKKLKALGENIESQIKVCIEKGIPNSLEGINTFNHNFIKDIKEEKVEHYKNKKEEQILNINKALEKERITDISELYADENLYSNIGEDEADFDLEKEVMNSPVLRTVMSTLKPTKESCFTFPAQRESYPSTSTFRIYEFSNEEIDCFDVNDGTNVLTSYESRTHPKTQQTKQRTQQSNNSKMWNFVNSDYSTRPDRAYRTTSNANTELLQGGRQRTAPHPERTVQFADELVQNNYPRKVQKNLYDDPRNYGAQNVTWYSGPNLYKTLSHEDKRNNPQLFEYKMQQPRTRKPKSQTSKDAQPFGSSWQSAQYSNSEQSDGSTVLCDLESMENDSYDSCRT